MYVVTLSHPSTPAHYHLLVRYSLTLRRARVTLTGDACAGWRDTPPSLYGTRVSRGNSSKPIDARWNVNHAVLRELAYIMDYGSSTRKRGRGLLPIPKGLGELSDLGLRGRGQQRCCPNSGARLAAGMSKYLGSLWLRAAHSRAASWSRLGREPGRRPYRTAEMICRARMTSARLVYSSSSM